LFQWVTYWTFGPLPPDMMLYMHPVAFAAWAGLLLTTLNLMPFSQLDGGHVFYALLGRKSVPVVHCIFAAAIIAIAWFQLWHWSLILILIALIGISHPPTADDTVPLKPFRHCLGWATLLFVFIGFVPTPLDHDGYEPPKKPVSYSTALPSGFCSLFPTGAGRERSEMTDCSLRHHPNISVDGQVLPRIIRRNTNNVGNVQWLFQRHFVCRKGD